MTDQAPNIARNRLLIWLLALLPSLLALPFLSAGDTASAGAWLNLAGRLTGIWGLALLLVAAMLCCRVPGFDLPFGGLTKLWQLHHQLGAAGFLLILVHPLLLALGAVEFSLEVAIATLFTPTPALLWGWIALLVLMIFMAPTFSFFGEPEYQRWKWLHRLSGITVVLALVHTFMLNRTLPGLWGQLTWGLFALLTLAAIGWRWIFSRWRGRQQYRVSKVERPANNVVELSLEPQSGLLRYDAGQFVYLSPHDSELDAGVDEEHPYTLSSSPDEPVLRIAIKSLGDASHALQSVRADTLVSIEGPYGGFFPASTAAPELWIAGGIGITPFLARLRHCTRRDQSLNAHLIYCVQDETRELYGDELRNLMEFLPDSQLHLHYFYKKGPLNAAFIAECCPDFLTRTAYICGPVPLQHLAEQVLRQGGLPANRIVSEEFALF
jgi:predicted ferric reductase